MIAFPRTTGLSAPASCDLNCPEFPETQSTESPTNSGRLIMPTCVGSMNTLVPIAADSRGLSNSSTSTS